jgi:hypothetical protein
MDLVVPPKSLNPSHRAIGETSLTTNTSIITNLHKNLLDRTLKNLQPSAHLFKSFPKEIARHLLWLSAQTLGEEVPLKMVEVHAEPRPHHIKLLNILSNASCTTNCLAPPTMVIQKTFGIERAG